jgi:1-acyl-sn-glycerol-3-phosphate acyltransferase
LIRSVWVVLAGAVATFLYAFRVLISMWLKRDDLFFLGHDIPRRWALAILRLSGAEVKAEGLENLPNDAPRVLISNHESWFDVFALCAVLPVQFRFVGKQELARIPVFGAAWVGSGHLAIDRGDRTSAIDTLQEAARQMHERDLTIIMFPEGTRSPDGELQRFKKGAFVLALEASCPIVPVGIRGSREVMPKGSFRIRRGTIEVRVGPPISTEGLAPHDRERLLEVSRAAVDALRGSDPPAELAPGVD